MSEERQAWEGVQQRLLEQVRIVNQYLGRLSISRYGLMQYNTHGPTLNEAKRAIQSLESEIQQIGY